MNREILFRVYDTKQKVWIHDTEHAVSLFGETILLGGFVSSRPDGTNITITDLDDLVAMQYTSLKDGTKWEDLTEAERKKWVLGGNTPSDWKGKKIFEGDIVTNDSEQIWIVVWDAEEARCGLQYRTKENGICHINSKWIIETNLKQIGNIYDNPELIDMEGK